MKKRNKEFCKAGAFLGAGAGLGFLKGGAIGIAGFGGAVGAPLWLAGAGVGLAGYGLYKLGESFVKSDSPKNKQINKKKKGDR